MIVHHSISFKSPSERSIFKKRVLPEKKFKTTPSAVCAVGTTKDFEGFLITL